MEVDELSKGGRVVGFVVAVLVGVNVEVCTDVSGFALVDVVMNGIFVVDEDTGEDCCTVPLIQSK